MFSSFLLMLREGLEAALIIGIILGFLNKTHEGKYKKQIYWGILFAILASGITAFIFKHFAGGFEGKSEEIFEGLIMIFAVFVLTSMIIWMKKQSQNIKENLENQMNNYISSKNLMGLVGLAFISVYREGVEVVLFFNALSHNRGNVSLIIGSVLGLLTAVLIAYIIFKTTVKLNLKKFFKYTGFLLIFISAGLLSYGVHELQEAAVIPIINEHIYNINSLINEDSTVGSFLNALFGYNGNPSLIESLSYLIYLSVSIKFFSKK